MGTWIHKANPSIEYLELLAVCMGVFCWSQELRNKRIVMFCDNQSVVTMINNTTSSCKNCMILIMKLVLRSLEFNMRIFSKWVQGSANLRADYLSRQKIMAFKQFVEKEKIALDKEPTLLHEDLWPVSKIWVH